MIRFVFIALLFLTACGDGGGGSPPPPVPPPVQIQIPQIPEAWYILYSKGMPDHPATVIGGGWSFDFPPAPGSVHYVTVPVSGYAKGNLSVAIEVLTTGTPFFDWHTAPDNTCEAPSSARLFIQRRGDDMSGTVGTTEFYRWWSNPQGYVLAAGSSTLTVPLQPSEWSSVLGKKGDVAPAMFDAAINDIGSVGLTFGGGCFFGHGVFVSGGTARFIMREFKVE